MTCAFIWTCTLMKNSNILMPLNKMSDERKCSQNCPYTTLHTFTFFILWWWRLVFGVCLLYQKYCIYSIWKCGIGSFLSVIFVWLMRILSIYSVSYGCHIFVFCLKYFSPFMCTVDDLFIQRSVYLNNFLVANLSDKQLFLCCLIINTRIRYYYFFLSLL